MFVPSRRRESSDTTPINIVPNLGKLPQVRELALLTRHNLHTALTGNEFDLSVPAVYARATADFSISAYQYGDIKLLRRWSHLDRMEHALRAMLAAITENDRFSPQQIFDVAVNSLSGRYSLSDEQKGIIRKAAEEYVRKAGQIADYRSSIFSRKNKTPRVVNGQRNLDEVLTFMDGLGIEVQHPQSTILDFHHPLVTVVEVTKDDFAGIYDDCGGLSDRSADSLAGFYIPLSSAIDQTIGSSVCFVNKDLPNAEKRITKKHEIMHAVYAMFLNSDKYLGNNDADSNVTCKRVLKSNKDNHVAARSLKKAGVLPIKSGDIKENPAEIITFIQGLREYQQFVDCLKNEMIAYLWGGEISSDTTDLFGASWRKIARSIKNPALLKILRTQYKDLLRQVQRLDKLGYEREKIALKIVTSTSVEEAIARLMVLG